MKSMVAMNENALKEPFPYKLEPEPAATNCKNRKINGERTLPSSRS